MDIKTMIDSIDSKIKKHELDKSYNLYAELEYEFYWLADAVSDLYGSMDEYEERLTIAKDNYENTYNATFLNIRESVSSDVKAKMITSQNDGIKEALEKLNSEKLLNAQAKSTLTKFEKKLRSINRILDFMKDYNFREMQATGRTAKI